MHEKTLNDLLADFSPTKEENKNSLKDGKPVTIWLPLDAWTRYGKLQNKSGRKFSKKARELLMALIETAEARAC